MTTKNTMLIKKADKVDKSTKKTAITEAKLVNDDHKTIKTEGEMDKNVIINEASEELKKQRVRTKKLNATSKKPKKVNKEEVTVVKEDVKRNKLIKILEACSKKNGYSITNARKSTRLVKDRNVVVALNYNAWNIVFHQPTTYFNKKDLAGSYIYPGYEHGTHFKVKNIDIDQFKSLVDKAIKCKKTTAEWKAELGVIGRIQSTTKKTVEQKLAIAKAKMDTLKAEMVALKKTKTKAPKKIAKAKAKVLAKVAS